MQFGRSIVHAMIQMNKSWHLLHNIELKKDCMQFHGESLGLLMHWIGSHMVCYVIPNALNNCKEDAYFWWWIMCTEADKCVPVTTVFDDLRLRMKGLQCGGEMRIYWISSRVQPKWGGPQTVWVPTDCLFYFVIERGTLKASLLEFTTIWTAMR